MIVVVVVVVACLMMVGRVADNCAGELGQVSLSHRSR